MYSCTDTFIFTNSLQSEFSSVSSNCLPWQMQNHIGCIYVACPYVAFPYVFFLTSCWMFHKKNRSWWWQISTDFSPPKFAILFLMNNTFTFSKGICVDGWTKNATQSNTTSPEFLQPLMSCFRQCMGGWKTVAQVLFCGFFLPKG